jgi:hypothetical protein
MMKNRREIVSYPAPSSRAREAALPSVTDMINFS